METQQNDWKMPAARFSTDDLPSENLLRFYSSFEHCALLLGTISFFGTGFVIVKASTKNMEKYKWLLLHEIVWSYLFDICLCLIVMVPLFPYKCGYSIGLIRHTNPYVTQTVFKLFIGCGVGKGYSLFIMFLHRHIQVLPECKFGQLYQNSTRLGRIFFVLWLFLEAVIVGPIFLIDVKDQTAIIGFFSSQDPLLRSVILKEPSAYCYALNSKTIRLYGIVGFCLTAAILTMPPLMFQMYRWLIKTKSTSSPSTFRIQKMLFISICVQIITSFFFLIIPLYLGIFLDLLAIPKASIIICFLVCLACLHSSFDCLIIILFITPYRRFVFGKILRLLGIEQTTTSVTFVTPMNSQHQSKLTSKF